MPVLFSVFGEAGWTGIFGPIFVLGDARQRDQYDPDQAIHRQMSGFSELIKRSLGETISFRYETCENNPHVPFPCLYDGVRFATMGQPKK